VTDSPRKRALGCVLHAAAGFAAVAGLYHAAPDPHGAWEWLWRFLACPTLLLALTGLGLWWEDKAQHWIWSDARFCRSQALAFPLGGALGFALWVFLH
jgi:hypothetical protein